MKSLAKFPLLYILLALFAMNSCSVPLKKKNILVIGDSNGEAKEGWVYQFQQLRGGGPIVNTSVGGNTIGFDGMGQSRLNTLDQLSVYLRKAYAEMGNIDEILISLGTNDCKQEYDGMHLERVNNLKELLKRTETFFQERGQDVPRIVLISPPPAGLNSQVTTEFRGAASCVNDLTNAIQRIAAEQGHCFVNLLEEPGAAVLDYSKDGIHFEPAGYQLLAKEIMASCY